MDDWSKLVRQQRFHRTKRLNTSLCSLVYTSLCSLVLFNIYFTSFITLFIAFWSIPTYTVLYSPQ